MANDYFEFKQFRICQDGAAMKVGTDGVLLGAWAGLDGHEKHILDVGTGTGLIALMAAQLTQEAIIDAVEIDAGAARQATENGKASPWPDRIRVHHTTIQEFSRRATLRYDHILSNPPFFVRSLKAPDASRTTARHADTLSFIDLACAAHQLLAPQGRLSVIYPTGEAAAFETAAREKGLFCTRKTTVRGTPDGVPKRVLMEFTKQEGVCRKETLTIELDRHRYTDEYIALTRDFYLKF